MRRESRVDSRSSTEARREAAAALRARVVALLVTLALVTAALPAQADRYDSRRSGFPLRIVAYVVHPIGVVLDTLIFRPAHWLGTREPVKTLFGHTGD